MDWKSETAIKKKSVRFFVIGILVLVAVAVVGGLSGAAIFSAVRKANQDKRRECVLKIGDINVSREEFELFCITVIEGSDFENLRINTASDNALAVQIKLKATEYAKQYYALRTRAEETEISLSPLERAEIDKKAENVPEGEDPEKYYLKNYGVTTEGYREFLYGWKLIDKYVNYAADNYAVDEELKRSIFDANAEELGWGLADVIYFDISVNDSGSAELKKSTAEKICETINGIPDIDKERAFRTFYDNFNDPGFSSSGINVALTGEIASAHPELFEAVKKAVEGYCYVVGDAGSVFVVRVRERFMFDFYKDTAELAVLLRADICRRIVEDAINDPRFGASAVPAMDSVDVKPLITARIEINGR